MIKSEVDMYETNRAYGKIVSPRYVVCWCSVVLASDCFRTHILMTLLLLAHT